MGYIRIRNWQWIKCFNPLGGTDVNLLDLNAFSISLKQKTSPLRMVFGGEYRSRTDDLLAASQTL